MLQLLEEVLFSIGKESPRTRRQLARDTALGAGIAAFLSTLASHPATAQAQAEKYDVSYLWHPDIEAVLDYQEDVARILGPDVARELHIVQGTSGRFGLIYDRNASKTDAEKTAQHHHKLLQQAELDRAVIIKDEGYHDLFNVEYKKGTSVNALKRSFETVYRTLGPEVGKNLVIERVNGKYALVWRRRGDENSTRNIAERHKTLLQEKGFNPSTILENNNQVEYGESSYLDETEPPIKPPRKFSEPRRPVAPDSLERKIEKYVQNHRTADEQTSWSVYDFTTGEKIVSINEDATRKSASMMKPFAALAYFHLVQQGKRQYNAEAKKHMKKMIQKSNNASTNWVMRQVGGPQAMKRILTEHYGYIFKDISIVEYIPSGGQTYRNKASAHDYSRFLYALWNDDLPQAREMRRLMALPGRDRVYTGAERVPTGTLVYNKTGSTARLCGDMSILYARGRDVRRHAYTLIGIVEKKTRTSNYGAWIKSRGDLIRKISNLTYDHQQTRHN